MLHDTKFINEAAPMAVYIKKCLCLTFVNLTIGKLLLSCESNFPIAFTWKTLGTLLILVKYHVN